MDKYKSLPVIGLLCLLSIAGCNKNENQREDSISIEGNISEIRFAPEDTEPRTVVITSSTEWYLNVSATWVSVTPEAGEAGTSTLTVAIVDEDCPETREADVIIVAGTAKVSFKVIQEAPVNAESIVLSAAQRRIVVGQTLPLELTVIPEGAELGAVSYTSSDEAVASVDAEGTVTAVAVGEAVITAVADGLSAEYAVEVTEVFTTDGLGTEYTFEMLSALPAGVVSGEGGTYTVNSSMILADGDVLTMDGTSTVLVGDEVGITVMGTVDFTPAEKAEIRPVDDNSVPKYLYFTENGGGAISNMRIVCLPIRNFGGQPLTVEDCELTGVVQSYAAVNLGGEFLTTVRNCRITDNVREGISGGANIASPLLFENNHLENNSYDSRNRPYINVTVGGDGNVDIIGNTIVGPFENTTNGGIAVSNMMGLSGSNKVLIEGNDVRGCRYGITTNGVMDVRIMDNVLVDNKWDSNAMTGGSGVSIYNSTGGQKVYMSGNRIEGHLWGITNIGNVAGNVGPELNLGNLTEGEGYNPGGNVFKDNGNGGVLYDLYNNSPMTVYAQGNTWNVEVQDEESIESVIFHKHDDGNLGEVIFMPPAE